MSCHLLFKRGFINTVVCIRGHVGATDSDVLLYGRHFVTVHSEPCLRPVVVDSASTPSCKLTVHAVN